MAENTGDRAAGDGVPGTSPVAPRGDAGSAGDQPDQPDLGDQPDQPDLGDQPDQPDLGDLMHAAFRRLRHRWSEQLAPFDLTPYQFRALQAVGGHLGPHGAHGRGTHGHGPGAADAEGLRLKDLAERMRIAPRSATEVVDQLEGKGLVERRPDPADRRATRIVLTGAGVGMRSQIREERRREAGDYFSVLSQPDQAELRRLLAELVRGQDC